MSLFPLVRAVDHSNMSYGHKSALSEMIDRVTAGRFGMAPRVGQHVLATVNVVKEMGEAAVIGPALAAAHVFIGLDKKLPGSNTKVPMDLVSASLLAGVAIALPGETGAHTAGELAGKIGTVYGFRKMYDFLAAAQKRAGKSPVGSFGNESGADNEWSSSSLGAEATQSLESALQQL
jgi:hypothetical protein